jgi:hypothetical protein
MSDKFLAFVIKSLKENKYLGFDTRFILDCSTIHGATLFNTEQRANDVIKELDQENEDGYNPMEWFKPLKVITLEVSELDNER